MTNQEKHELLSKALDAYSKELNDISIPGFYVFEQGDFFYTNADLFILFCSAFFPQLIVIKDKN